MIVRIVGEGQFVVDESALPEFNELDAQVERAMAAKDQDQLTQTLTTLLAKVRAKGTPVPDDVLAESDLILPEAASTVEELTAWLDELPSDEGLIPG